MEMPQLPGKSGFGVSYTLLYLGGTQICYPKEDIGAGHILVSMVEVQSTWNSAVQNSIYGVGSLLKNVAAGKISKPILCLTIFMNKLLIARLQSNEKEHNVPKSKLGQVSCLFYLHKLLIDAIHYHQTMPPLLAADQASQYR